MTMKGNLKKKTDPHPWEPMDARTKKILFISGGAVLTAIAVAATVRARKRRKAWEATGNKLPPGFRNWNGGARYLSGTVRGIRNNNPGNIRRRPTAWKGKVPFARSPDSSFEVFTAPVYGVRAMARLLRNYIDDGYNTVEKIVGKYAPGNENDTEGYIEHVAKDIQVRKNKKLKPNKKTLKALVLAMSRRENGGDYISDSLFEQAYAII
jgi:hypothetical protein